MTLLHALLLSVVEGITEFLPVSSTGHLILVSRLLRIEPNSFTTSFDIFIQLGAILAVVGLYARKLIMQPRLIKQTLIAFVPTGILGFTLYKLIKVYLLENSLISAIMLLVGGVALLVFDRRLTIDKAPTKTLTSLSITDLLSIGLFQAAAMVPGVSRSAATIIGGLAVGLSRSDAVEFSFLLAIPTMIAATTFDLAKNAYTFTQQDILLLGIGFLGALATAYVTVRMFLGFVKGHSLAAFGLYRIGVALAFLLLFSFGL